MREAEKPSHPTNYLVITVANAYIIATALRQSGLAAKSVAVAKIIERLGNDTGGDMQDIVDKLRELEICSACVIEGQESSCRVLWAQKQGRRLRRLLERA